jgi:hypothetical protein
MSEAELSAVAARLKRHPGPAFRKAYLANLLDSAKRFLAAGNERGAEYCRAKVAMALDEAGVPSMDESAANLASVSSDQQDGSGDALAKTESSAEDSAEDIVTSDETSTASASTASEGGAESTAAGSVRRSGEGPRRPRAKPKERPLTPTEIFRRNWRLDRIKDAETILNRHGARLSALEFSAYREKLDKLREAGLSASTMAASTAAAAAKADRLDAGLQDLRTRLYGRVLKSQRLSLRGQRMPMTLARLALAPADRSTRPSAQPGLPPLPTRVAPATAPGTTVRVDPAWQPVIGPYNDRYNMEDLLGLIADADPAWVEEFLDLYRGLSGMQTLMQSIASLKKT